MTMQQKEGSIMSTILDSPVLCKKYAKNNNVLVGKVPTHSVQSPCIYRK